MARNIIGAKKVARLREKTGLPVITALTRGGTDHRIDLCLDNGSIVHLFSDGTMEKAEIKWDIKKWREK